MYYIMKSTTRKAIYRFEAENSIFSRYYSPAFLTKQKTRFEQDSKSKDQYHIVYYKNITLSVKSFNLEVIGRIGNEAYQTFKE